MALKTEFVRQQINQGIKAHKAGDERAAWLHFQAALREDTENITALLWLAYLANDHEKRVFLLERVLEIDPDNKRAKAGLSWAEQKQARLAQIQSDDRQGVEKGAGSELSQRLKRVVGASKLKEQARKGTIAQRARRRISP